MTSKQASHFTFGLLLIAVGLVLLSGQLDLGWRAGLRHLWPVVFLVLGAGHLLNSEASDRVGKGLWFLCIGGVLLLHSYDILSLRQSWPLFIVAGGVSMMFASNKHGCSPKTFASDAPERRP